MKTFKEFMIEDILKRRSYELVRRYMNVYKTPLQKIMDPRRKRLRKSLNKELGREAF